MDRILSFDVTYDRNGDVLYLSTRSDEATRGIEDENGCVWRYDKDGEVIGVTVVDFNDFWTARMPVLAAEMSRRFHIPLPEAQVVLDRAIEK